MSSTVTFLYVCGGLMLIAAVAALAALCERNTRNCRRIVRYVFDKREPYVGAHDYTVCAMGRVSLTHDIAIATNPVDLTPMTTSPLAVYLRALLGRSGSYVSVCPDSLCTVDKYTTIKTDGTHVWFYGTGAYNNEAVVVSYSATLANDATVRVACFARHLTVRPDPRAAAFGGVIRYAVFEAGPLHYCSQSCRHYTTTFTAKPITVTRYGGVLVHKRPHVMQFAWRDGNAAIEVSTDLLYGILSRYYLAAKAGQYHIMSTGLNNANLFPLVAHAAANGMTLDNIPRIVPDECVVAITTTMLDYTAKPLHYALVHNPLVANPAMNTNSGGQAMRDSVFKRVIEPCPTYTVTREDAEMIADFATRFADGIKLDPLEYEELEEILLPHQRDEFQELGSYWCYARSFYNTFIKSEMVGAGKAARVITAPKGPRNYKESRYIRRVAEHAKRHFHAYCSGSDPATIEQRVHQFHSRCRTDGVDAVEIDFTSYDASTGELCLALEAAILKTMFGIEWHAEIESILAETYAAKVRADFGQDANGVSRTAVTFGNGTYSGVSGTTSRNSDFHMFVQFRMARYVGKSSHESWAHTLACLYSGDDGLARSLGVISYDAMAGTGLKMKARTYNSGYTHFLGRLYPSPYDTPSNVACAKRVLSKIHMVHVPQGKTAMLAMAQRALGCLVSDPHTPLLSAYWRACLASQPALALDPAFYSAYDFERLTENSAYTSTGLDRDLVMECYADVLGVTSDALASLELAFEKVVAVPGAVYPALCPVVIVERAGLVIDGMSLSMPPLPPADIQRDKDVVERQYEDAVNAAQLASALALALPPLPPGPLHFDAPRCAICTSREHSTPQHAIEVIVADEQCARCCSAYHRTDDVEACNLHQRRNETFSDTIVLTPAQLDEMTSLLPSPPRRPRGSRGGKNHKSKKHKDN